jgi:hypothetical protein
MPSAQRWPELFTRPGITRPPGFDFGPETGLASAVSQPAGEELRTRRRIGPPRQRS